MSTKGWLKPILVVLVWAAVAFVFASNSHFMRVFAGRESNYWLLMLWYQASWVFWWFGTVVVLALSRRFPFDRGHWRRNSLVHLLAAAGMIVAMTAWDVALVGVLGSAVDLSSVFRSEQPASFFVTVRNWLPSEASWGLLVYVALLCAAHAREYYRSYRAEELAASRLEAQLTHARLQVLLMQLQPHFLFNTLNAIMALVRRDPDAAERTITRLSELLRHTIEHAEQQEVPLSEELDFVRSYVEIERVRFRERLLVQFDVAPDTFDAMVPQLILQPLVENALLHGFTPDSSPARIEVRSRLRGVYLQIEVWDNGRSLAEAEEGTGTGLATTRERLETLYGDSYRFILADTDGGGVAATLEIPLRMRRDGLEAADRRSTVADPGGDRRRRASGQGTTALAPGS